MSEELDIDSIGACVDALSRLLFYQGDLNQKGECPFCGEKIKGDGHCQREECPVSQAVQALKDANAWEGE